jgi:hypothetical protein
MELQTTLAPASNGKSDFEIVMEPLIENPTINQIDISTSLTALFEENTLAKIVGPAEAYLENNVGTLLCKNGSTSSDSDLLEPPCPVSRDSTSDWFEQGCVQMQGCRVLDMWIFPRQPVLSSRKNEEISRI